MLLENAVNEAKRLNAEGYKELVITGIEISSYGQDLGNACITDLIEQICLAVPEMRIRLGSLEPRTVTEDFCERLSRFNNLCPHFHLSLQSGSEETLKRMGRKYTPDDYYSRTAALRRSFPNCGITTDLIVGFPGETEDEFEETLTFLKKCSFSAVHVFPYSKRPGTRAAVMDNQLPSAIRKERSRRASECSKHLRETFLRSQVETVAEVLFENSENGLSHGFTGNYCEVCVSHEALRNEILNVRITGADSGILKGDLI
jgi:2-methylthioadenine synthetase